MRSKSRTLLVLPLALCASVAVAGDIEAELRKRFASLEPTHIRESPIPGLYEIGAPNRIFYASADGRYIVHGRMFDLDERADLTEPLARQLRADKLAGLDEATMVIYDPTGPVRHTLTVFTDIDCPYCQRFHSEIDALLAGGVRVRYLGFPRTGQGGESFRKAVAVWCAADRQQALSEAKAGLGLPQGASDDACAQPIHEHMALAEELGLTGTPLSFTDQGERIDGYMPAEQLLLRLDRARDAAVHPGERVTVVKRNSRAAVAH